MRREVSAVSPSGQRLLRKIDALRDEIAGLGEEDARRLLNTGVVDAAIVIARQTRAIRSVGNMTLADAMALIARGLQKGRMGR